MALGAVITNVNTLVQDMKNQTLPRGLFVVSGNQMWEDDVLELMVSAFQDFNIPGIIRQYQMKMKDKLRLGWAKFIKAGIKLCLVKLEL